MASTKQYDRKRAMTELITHHLDRTQDSRMQSELMWHQVTGTQLNQVAEEYVLIWSIGAVLKDIVKGGASVVDMFEFGKLCNRMMLMEDDLHGWYTIDRPDNDHLVFVIDPNYAANHYDFPIDAEDKPRTKLFQNWDLTSSEAPHFVPKKKKKTKTKAIKQTKRKPNVNVNDTKRNDDVNEDYAYDKAQQNAEKGIKRRIMRKK
eukprot:24962_1